LVASLWWQFASVTWMEMCTTRRTAVKGGTHDRASVLALELLLILASHELGRLDVTPGELRADPPASRCRTTHTRSRSSRQTSQKWLLISTLPNWETFLARRRALRSMAEPGGKPMLCS
jgi:hypothetical protein